MQTKRNYPDPVLKYGPLISSAFQPAGEDGVYLDDLPVGAVVEVVTGHNTYRLENRGNGNVLMSGHPVYCPEAVQVELHGSVGDSSVIKMWFIGRGMRLEFRHPKFGVVRTSHVREIHQMETTH